ncbi:hypothetical protein ACH5RR_005143 [Cinchona calisaya]|uniref:Protein LURP-one-related 10-like n=1 Tax=Cinchona calisaya TaxID=153742 RepID=A0ABD3AKD0_9GENT
MARLATINSVGGIVGPQYCVPYPVDLAIVKKVFTLTDGNFVVADANDNLMFKVERKLLSLHDKRVILDAAGNPILTLRHKVLTAHSRWQVFRGESSGPQDLVFTARTSSIIQFRRKLNIYLPYNTSEDFCDFKVKGSWFERSCVVYAGESSSPIIAQMHKKLTAQSLLLGKDKFMVTVYPNVDYAFIVALIVILDAINTRHDD